MPASARLWLNLAFSEAFAHVATRDSQKVTPVEKVIELLKKLGDQVQEEGKNEAAEYDKYACFCKEQASNKLYSIGKSKEKVNEMAAEITYLQAEISDLDDSISTLTTRITEIVTEMGNKKTTRDAEHATYVTEEEDLSNAIQAIQGAMEALGNSKNQMQGDTDLSLLQKIKPLADTLLDAVSRAPRGAGSDAQLQMVLALAQESQHGVPASGKSHDSVYHSNDIIETLKGLLKEFNIEKKETDEAEFDLQVAYDKAHLDLANEKKFKFKEKSEKETRSETLTENLETTQSNKDDETNAKEADEDFLNVLTTQCEDKATTWDQRSKARAGELTALAEATSLLQSGVQGNYEANKKLVGLVSKHQHIKSLSFLQFKDARTLMQHRVMSLLNSKAIKLHSAALTGLVTKVALSDDHFVKVRGLIKDLIAKLKADANAEATSKSFCDKEMKVAIDERDAQSLAIETQTALISKNKAEKEILEREIEQLTQEIADAHKSLNEATTLRNEEKTANEKTLAMSEAGKEALESAISVLNAFYKPAFVQQSYTPPDSDRDGNTVGDLAPKTSFDGDYEGNKAASKGILGMMDVILSDFDRTITTVTDEEAAAVKAFDEYEKSTKQEIDSKKKGENNQGRGSCDCSRCNHRCQRRSSRSNEFERRGSRGIGKIEAHVR